MFLCLPKLALVDKKFLFLQFGREISIDIQKMCKNVFPIDLLHRKIFSDATFKVPCQRGEPNGSEFHGQNNVVVSGHHKLWHCP
jgi:hypothetical protein